MSNIVFLGNHYLTDPKAVKNWINKIIEQESFTVEVLNYQFVNDHEMLKVNKKYLDHDTYTDIITFDYTEGHKLSADIYISTERVSENAVEFNTSYSQEMTRVLIHGVLHCIGYADKTPQEKQIMRNKENETLKLFHVEHKI